MHLNSSNLGFAVLLNFLLLEINKKNSFGLTKSTALVKELAYIEKKDIVQFMKSGPYSIVTYGSNDVNCSE